MFQAYIYFPQDKVHAEFESEFAFVKWLGYLKEHGLATVKLANSTRSVIVFKNNITYIETEGATEGLKLS